MRPRRRSERGRHGLITAASIALLALPALAACTAKTDTSTAKTDTSTAKTDKLVLEQGGLPGILLSRDVLDVSVSDLEDAFGGRGTYFLAGQTESCGLAINEDLGIAAMTNSDRAVLAVVVQTPGAQTKEGVTIGDSIDDVLQTYGNGQAEVDTRTSATGGPLVIVNDLETPNQEPGLRSLLYAFDTDTSRTVTRIRAGFLPYVAHVDYCSEKAHRPKDTGWPLQ